MIESFEESNQGCLRYLTREVLMIILVGLLMALPCALCGTLILRLGD
jgi:hypothetical protein